MFIVTEVQNVQKGVRHSVNCCDRLNSILRKTQHNSGSSVSTAYIDG